MSGETLKLILEDVADNAFNPDPFYQHGGDMVRVSGLTYVINPTMLFGSRISDMRLESGELIEASRNYTVAGWATVGEVSSGPPVWVLVAEHLRSRGTVRIDKVNQPEIIMKAGNPGVGNWKSS